MAPQFKLHVLDGTATLFRAYFGMNKFQAPDGREVGGVLGFGQTLARFVKEVGPSHVALVFDTPVRTFRHDIFPDYKANRAEPPEDMWHQFDLSYTVAEALGFRCFKTPGYEADDLMATMARRCRQAGVEIHLVTPDKDVMQLVEDRVFVMDPKTLETIDAAKVKAKFGLPPKLLLDYLSLAGDSTDNIPGVKGVGPKTALALVAGLGTLDEIYDRLDDVASLDIRGAKGLAAKLESHREAAFLSRDLVRLHTEAPLGSAELNFSQLRYRGPKVDADTLFDEIGFHAPLRNIRSLMEA